MRKWLGIGAVVLLATAVTYWHFDVTTRLRMVEKSHKTENSQGPVAVEPKKLAEDELSEFIEPLSVEGCIPSLLRCEPQEEPPLARVELPLGMKQPPRPDAGFVSVPRMPYADEEEEPSRFSWQGVRSFLSSVWSRVSCSLSPRVETNIPSEESEPKDVTPTEPEPMPVPQPDPAMDYHRQQQHCPYQGGCPYYRK